VLRILKHTDIVTSDKRLAAYIERCTARPAFKRAFDAQIGDSKTLHSQQWGARLSAVLQRSR
jgi:hypothetical protein